jgi:hypothetical protein
MINSGRIHLSTTKLIVLTHSVSIARWENIIYCDDHLKINHKKKHLLHDLKKHYFEHLPRTHLDVKLSGIAKIKQKLFTCQATTG